MNANDAKLTALTTAPSGSMVEDSAPTPPASGSFDLVLEAVAGSVLRNGGAPYTPDGQHDRPDGRQPALACSDPAPGVRRGQRLEAQRSWPRLRIHPDVPHRRPGQQAGRSARWHTLQAVVSLISQNGQVVSIIKSHPFVLV
jgi:hypothetical protein